MADRLIDTVRHGDRVTIVDRFGKQRTGSAVMRGPHGWVLNMGGKHGTPGIASDENVTRVSRKRGQLGGATIRCELFASPKPRMKRTEYAGSFASCKEAHDYAAFLRKNGHKASVRRKGK